MNKYDMMIACNRKTSEEKINRAVTEIRQMLTDPGIRTAGRND